MSNQKSIIGCGYIPRNIQAVCLKSNQDAKLGDVEYKIIADPYERTFEDRRGDIMRVYPLSPKMIKRLAVNLLDANTGLTYAVEYEPANLVRTAPEPKRGKQENTPFVERMRELAEELGEYVKNGNTYTPNRGIVFFAIENNVETETSSGAAFVGGGGKNIIRSIAASCSENPQVLEILKAATTRALFDSVMKGGKE